MNGNIPEETMLNKQNSNEPKEIKIKAPAELKKY